MAAAAQDVGRAEDDRIALIPRRAGGCDVERKLAEPAAERMKAVAVGGRSAVGGGERDAAPTGGGGETLDGVRPLRAALEHRLEKRAELVRGEPRPAGEA